MLSKIKTYLILIAIALGVGIAAAFFTRNSMNIYGMLVKPPLALPSVLFPIVWTVLYILMGVSSAIVFLRKKEMPDEAANALVAYAVQLVLNFFWPLIFFNMQAFLLSFIWLVFLWFVIVKMIFRFYKVSPFAAYLQLPYLIWVTFAGYLNFMFYLLN